MRKITEEEFQVIFENEYKKFLTEDKLPLNEFLKKEEVNFLIEDLSYEEKKCFFKILLRIKIGIEENFNSQKNALASYCI